MSRILVVSLGGSPEPVVNCINSLRPDRVVFFCSEGSQSQVETVLRTVPIPEFEQARDIVVLQQRFSRRQGEEVISEIDHLEIVYARATDLLMRLRRDSPGSTLMVDYTGGTKTMAAGLAMAAIDVDGVQLQLTTIPERPKGENALSGPSLPVAVAKIDIQARRLLDLELPPLLKRFDYGAAGAAVSRVRQLETRSSTHTAKLLIRLEQLLNALDAWDRFDHRHAVEGIGSIGDQSLNERFQERLQRILACRQLVEGESLISAKFKGHGLEAVEDLLLNAKRRAAQQRWDDAVGRLYRAAELTAQTLLLIDVCDKVGTEGIRTANVAVERLPSSLQEKYQYKSRNGDKLQLGLRDAFHLLGDLDHPTGLIWKQDESRYLNLLQIRNNSLYAHGFRPIRFDDWNRFQKDFGILMDQAIERLRRSRATAAPAVPQLPDSLEQLLPSPRVA
jgi:CRISPR-associated protein (TIGR02710 family)